MGGNRVETAGKGIAVEMALPALQVEPPDRIGDMKEVYRIGGSRVLRRHLVAYLAPFGHHLRVIRRDFAAPCVKKEHPRNE